MRTNEPYIGDRVHHEGRTHPTRVGWLQANGEIINILKDDDDADSVVEVMVEYGPDDHQFYDAEELEWTDALGGYWRVA